MKSLLFWTITPTDPYYPIFWYIMIINIIIVIIYLFKDTSRPMRELEEDGKAYHFTTREAMEADIRHHRYLEYGELNNNLYGTKLDSILSIVRSGKMCVIDCSPAVS